MSPVATCGTPRWRANLAAWVPLPAPGGPSRTIRTVRWPPQGLFQEALVVPHQELRLELLGSLERDADRDEDGCAAKRQVLDVECGKRDGRQDRHGGEEQRPWERDAGQDEVEVLGRGTPGADAGDEP